MDNILENLDPQQIIQDLNTPGFLNLLGDDGDLSGGPDDLLSEDDEEVLLEGELAQVEGTFPVFNTAGKDGDELSKDETVLNAAQISGSLFPSQVDQTSGESSEGICIPGLKIVNQARDTSDEEVNHEIPSTVEELAQTSAASTVEKGGRIWKLETANNKKPMFALRGNPGITVTRVQKSKTSYNTRSTSVNERKLRALVRSRQLLMRAEKEAPRGVFPTCQFIPPLELQEQEELLTLKDQYTKILEQIRQLKDSILVKHGICPITYQIKIESVRRAARITRRTITE